MCVSFFSTINFTLCFCVTDCFQIFIFKDFGSIFSTLLPGTQAKLSPPEGQKVLDGLEVKVGFGSVWKESLGELSGGQRSVDYRCRNLLSCTVLNRAGILQPKGGFQPFSRLYQPFLVINLFILSIDEQPIPPTGDVKSEISAEMVFDRSLMKSLVYKIKYMMGPSPQCTCKYTGWIFFLLLGSFPYVHGNSLKHFLSLLFILVTNFRKME